MGLLLGRICLKIPDSHKVKTATSETKIAVVAVR